MLTALVLVGLVLSGCGPAAPTSPVAMRQIGDSVVFSLGCEHPAISKVEVTGSARQATLWTVHSNRESASPMTDIQLGQAPNGFVEESELDFDWLGGSVAVWTAIPGRERWTNLLAFQSPDFPSDAGLSGWAYPGGAQWSIVEGTWDEYQAWLASADLGKWRCPG